MSMIEDSIEVDVPLRTAYNQWTQFEEFPKFMEGVREVRQIDDNTMHWCAEVGGKEIEWDAEITEQIPDQRIAWQSLTGPENSGLVTFEPTLDGKTRVTMQMEYEPEGFVENVGDMLGVTTRRVHSDLEHFKEMIESRGSETGAWRGTIN